MAMSGASASLSYQCHLGRYFRNAHLFVVVASLLQKPFACSIGLENVPAMNQSTPSFEIKMNRQKTEFRAKLPAIFSKRMFYLCRSQLLILLKFVRVVGIKGKAI